MRSYDCSASQISVQEALMTVNTTGTYRERVCLTSPVLRQFMHVDTDEEVSGTAS